MAQFLGLNCYHVEELRPAAALIVVEGVLQAKAIDVLVVEEFRLYPHKAKDQIWSTFPTCEMIGAIKYIHAKWGQGCKLAMQSATIKDPMFKQLRARKIKSQAKKQGVAGQHVLDAECHGYYWLLHGRLGR